MTKSGIGWYHNLGIFGLKKVANWKALSAAIQAETTNPEGLKQVASDILRIVVLSIYGGAYWDVGDSTPKKHFF